jgi:predicted secreted hydrolase
MAVILCALRGGVAGQAGFLQAVDPLVFEFPQDHGAHPGFRIEWWYYTGNAADEKGRPFGFQLTFFRVQLKPEGMKSASSWRTNDIYLGHLAVSDLAGERFLVEESRGRGAAGIGGVDREGGRVRVFLGPWEAVMEGPVHRLRGASDSLGDQLGDRFALDLTLTAAKPPVLHGEWGLSRKGAAPGQASYYYSLTRMACRGSISFHDHRFEVTGSAWMDHEFTSNLLNDAQVGWDWMGLQLSDGREIMVYELRDRNGATDAASSGTLVERDGSAVHLSRKDFVLKALATWRSPKSNALYPSQWQLELPGKDIRLMISPNMADQELATGESTGVTYWEGSVSVSGTVSRGPVTGSGYAELTGYAEPPDSSLGPGFGLRTDLP